MITIDEAFEAYRARVRALAAETVTLDRALGRVLVEPARSTVDLPPFPQSAMDGYAVRAASLDDAEREPVALPVALTVAATAWNAAPVLPEGACARIFTGGHVPVGADAVVMQEQVERDGDLASFRHPVAPGANVRHRGEELREGAVVMPPGRRLTAGRLGALAAAGIAEVRVHRRPSVTLLVTGDEVVPAGTGLRPGQVYDCNTPMATAWLASRGVEVKTVRLADEPVETRRQIAEALDGSDLVLTTGGVSVGEKDLVIAAARASGISDVFWKVAQKPGKPLYFGVREDAVMIGLPGNPAAVFVGLVVHVSRVLDALEGLEPPVARPGRLTVGVGPRRGRTEWARCKRITGPSGETTLAPLGGQASHMLSNLADTDAIARLPAGDDPLPAGTLVDFVLVDGT